MKQLLFLKGLPGSGKSTYARELVKQGNWKRLNKDDLRAMLDDSKWSKANEQLVNYWQEWLAKDILDKGINVIVDNTHLAPRHEERYKQLAKACNAKFVVKMFDIPLEECIKRDLMRPNSVGEKVIVDMYNQFLKPAPVVYKGPAGKPHAVICDIDGTLAHMGERSPYDWHKVKIDTADQVVIDMLRHYDDRVIILLSGRDAICKPETVEWLTDNRVPFNHLFMRDAGDMRKDAVIKREIFDRHIRDNFYIDFVLDDRNQVVDMWRNDVGLKVLQVAEGDF
jgi:predicted kinase